MWEYEVESERWVGVSKKNQVPPPGCGVWHVEAQAERKKPV